MDCGRGLNRSSTVAESGSFLVASRFIQIHPDLPRFITNTVQGGGRGATGLNRTSTVWDSGRIVSSTVVNRSAAVMNRRISVD